MKEEIKKWIERFIFVLWMFVGLSGAITAVWFDTNGEAYKQLREVTVQTDMDRLVTGPGYVIYSMGYQLEDLSEYTAKMFAITLAKRNGMSDEDYDTQLAEIEAEFK